MTFAQLIEDGCKRTKTSHAELARRLGVSKPRIPAMLRTDNMSEDLFKRCCEALGLNLRIQLIKPRGK